MAERPDYHVDEPSEHLVRELTRGQNGVIAYIPLAGRGFPTSRGTFLKAERQGPSAGLTLASREK